MAWWNTALLAAALALGATTLGSADATPTAAVDDGRELWTQNRCHVCHGEQGKADTKIGQKKKIADMSTAEWQRSHSDEQIRDVILNGFEREKDGKKTKHKAVKDASAKDADALLALIRSFGPQQK
jgi:mono/diheme cytochrome c family protein